jgi:hypothetical protein
MKAKKNMHFIMSKGTPAKLTVIFSFIKEPWERFVGVLVKLQHFRATEKF